MTALVVVLVLLLVTYVVTASNRFVRQRHLVEESWAQVEVELRRRQDLVPALVEQVRAFAAHEAEVLGQAHRAAVAAQGSDVDAAEAQLSRALHALPPVQSGPVQQLQAQLAETEDRIAAARRFHVANVRALDVRLETFPSALVARALGVERPDAADHELTDLERADLELPP